MGCNSMTGFGLAMYQGKRTQVKVEIRCVNHRFAEFNFRMPRELFAFEEDARNLIAKFVARGRVDVFITLEQGERRERRVFVDWQLLDAFMDLQSEAAKRYGFAAPTHDFLQLALAQPDVLQVETKSFDLPELREDVMSAISDACKELVAVRNREGERLRTVLAEKLAVLKLLLGQIRERAPLVVAAYRDKLQARMADFVSEVDEMRLLTEVGLLAERMDIDEELVRFDSHLEEAKGILLRGSPMGRQLDFTIQELHREMNTIGSKSQDPLISRAVVEAKTVIEQLREQTQNLE